MQFAKKALQYLSIVTACAGGSAALLPTGVFFPLYIYPGTNCVGWSAVSTGILAHPNVQFYIVVNPATGPGANGTQPDTTYQACTALLRTKGASTGNVKILGYVDTAYAGRAQADVLADINTYAGWATSYKPDGIFFDQVTSTAAGVSTYTTYSNQVHSKFSSGYVVLNPGVKPQSNDYYNIANQIVMFEDYYSNFNLANIVTGTATPGSKQAILVHTGPNPTDSSAVSGLKSKGVGSVFLTNFNKDSAYTNIPTDYVNFLNLVD